MPPKTPDNSGSDETELDAIFKGMTDEDRNPAELHDPDAGLETEQDDSEQQEDKEGEAAVGEGEAAESDSQQQQEPSEQTAVLRLRQYESTLIPAMQRETERLRQEVAQRESQFAGVQQYSQEIAAHGLTAQEAAIGLRMAANYKLNPTQFVQTLLSNLAASGQKLPDEAPASAVQASAIANLVKQQVDAALKPYSDVRKQQDEETQVRQQVDTFYTSFPDARVQQEAIAHIMSTYGLPLERAYYEAKLWCVQNGYDWTKPLTAQQPHSANPQPRQPNPATRRPTNPSHAKMNNAPVADPTLDWRQIVNQAVAEVNADGVA